MRDLKGRLREKDGLLEEQASRIDGLICDLRNIQHSHEGHLMRLRESHNEEIEQVEARMFAERTDVEISLKAAEHMIE